MSLPFIYVPTTKKKKEAMDSALAKYKKQEDKLEAEEMDENLFYRYLTTHCHPLFSSSSIVCIPHSHSIQGLTFSKEMIESHCFQPSRFFQDQHVTKQKHPKSIRFESPDTILTQSGYKEVRRIQILAEESVYVGRKKIRVYSIDRPLEGQVLTPCAHPSAIITIPPVRNAKNDLEFLNMFPENMEAIYELQQAVQEFSDTYVYIKGYNKTTVERIRHMYIKTYRTILQKNKLLEASCRAPSENDHFLELVENVVMSFLHKKIWIYTLQQLLETPDQVLDAICSAYAGVVLAQYSLRYPLSEMDVACFSDAIQQFQKMEHQAMTPLEKLAVLKTTLDCISSAVRDYVQQVGPSTCDTSVTSDEMIPLLAFILVQSHVPRMASLGYYMQHYRLAEMIEGSVYSFVLATLQSAYEFLRGDPLSLYDTSLQRARSFERHHRKSQSADFQKEWHILRPHSVLPTHERPRWATPTPPHRPIEKSNLGSSRPLFSSTMPSLSAPASPTQRHHKRSHHPPEIIHVPTRPTSMIHPPAQEDLGDFLNQLSLLEGDVTGMSLK
ncbi:hypothetical protein BY458DRAFT_525054 [Sporodiniella umbellata]|nr:hypothetical protein BY458DRAFT_525054 [Sporodiniella umbellata]